ncbi:MAG: carboxypeptidase regulatory-like domain-containing protein [Immundisolibacteraceae bacterium]|nr:carboxypeptidase regulatory-like domain-containing protein [Immundisolibacteraceae bacterium]
MRFKQVVMVLVGMSWLGSAWSLTVSGQVTDPQKKPVAGVMVTLQNPESGANKEAATITVFTDAAGRYQLQTAEWVFADDVQLVARKIGYGLASSSRPQQDSAELQQNFVLKPIDNIAGQVPASAWLHQFPLTDRGARFVPGQCAGCHQFPSDQIKAFAAPLATLTEPERKQEWLTVTSDESERVLEKVWRGSIQYMRSMAFHFSADTPVRWGLDPNSEQFKALLTAEYSLFSDYEEDIAATALAKFMQLDFTTMPRDAYPAAANPLVPDAGLTIREYDLRSDGWTREVALTPESDYVWLVEDNADRIGRLNPRTGRVKWIPVPTTGDQPQGPHTINVDRDGFLWITLEESYALARLDPRTEEWKIYPGFGEFSIAHDTCLDDERYVVTDIQGHLWLTLIGQNQMAELDPDSGKIWFYDMPHQQGETSFHAALYGCVISADLKKVWFTQLNGIIGSIDVQSKQIETASTFEVGQIPHRFAIDDQDVIWVALSGDGELLAYDTIANKLVGRYRLPDANSSPYSTTWDSLRKVVWVSGSNSDVIYRFNPANQQFHSIPMPRKRAFLRMIDVDRKTGDLWTTYAHLPVGAGPNYAVQVQFTDGVYPQSTGAAE